MRQRPSGRWVAEIKDSSQKLRLWLGTFDAPEDAALAYDKAARLLRGRNAKTNFPSNNHGSFMNTFEENCTMLRKNPRLCELLQYHTVMKKKPKCSSSSIGINWWRDQNTREELGSVSFDVMVEDTIVCSSSKEDGVEQDDQISDQNPESNKNNKLCPLSLGNSKVYSSVVVAPSFSASH